MAVVGESDSQQQVAHVGSKLNLNNNNVNYDGDVDIGPSSSFLTPSQSTVLNQN